MIYQKFIQYNLHRFYGKNRSFWKVILEVSNEKIKRKSDESFRKAFAIRNFSVFLLVDLQILI
ncbi:hypothetical protein [Thermosipho sp. (in: thermotogales)]|uniref:hypothetical protein n=1 Tax=Thermosipho sp. (in: thermotogales) TaxID=1968895 RepID=UPI00257DAF0B|nr:hypothetical protein [Thermosipho sp. (in: thermotogales)]